VPTYSYACTDCGNRFDVVQGFTDDALTRCEQCSGRLRKLFGSVGVVFKGSGFYRTDSREPAKSATNGSAKNGANASSESSSGSRSGETSGSGGSRDTSGSHSASKASESAKSPAATPS
jgi:putative FmdB family regulatory protein